MMTVTDLIEKVDQLPTADKWQLVKHLLDTLEQEQNVPAATLEWRAALKATYGILADDPIERPPQLPLEERDYHQFLRETYGSLRDTSIQRWDQCE